MPIYETFHERQARLRKTGDDVYVYGPVPRELKVQIIQIAENILGDQRAYDDSYVDGENVQSAYGQIVRTLRSALGVFYLPPTSESIRYGYREELKDYLLGEQDAERVMSALELICLIIKGLASQYEYRHQQNSSERENSAVDDINRRLKQHGIGYEYDGEIIRIDSEFVHVETVKPALALLRGDLYKTAQDKFLKAYEHLRSQDYQDALTNALKAFESTMKIIIDKKGWKVDSKATAKDLVEVCFQNGLIPAYWQNHMGGLRSMLESAIPTGRNRAGGHGGGPTPQPVPEYLAAYALHMTASTIVFLVSAEKSLP